MANTSLRPALLLALLCFVLAALTGTLLRYGLLHGFPFDLHFVNVRHAHSHLMYFGWVTPALFVLIAAAVQRATDRPSRRGFGAAIWLTLACAVIAYPPFFLSGYNLTQIGELHLPLSMIAASLNVLAWYAFVGVYLSHRVRLKGNLPLLCFDASLFLLVLSSLGAWGLAAAAFAPFASPDLMSLLVSFFLDLFSSGWFALALLGLLYGALPAASHGGAARIGLVLIVAGLLASAFGELLAVPAPVAAIGAAVAGVGLLTSAAVLGAAAVRQRAGALTFLALLLAFLGAVELARASPVVDRLMQLWGLEVFLLHGYLLGFVTLGLVALALRTFAPKGQASLWWMAAGAVLVLVSLVPLTALWPPAWRGRWALEFALWASVAPIVTAGAVWQALARQAGGSKTGGAHRPAP